MNKGHLPEQMRAQYFYENGTVNLCYKSLKDLGETKNVTLPKINTRPGSMVFGDVGYAILQIPPTKAPRNYVLYWIGMC